MWLGSRRQDYWKRKEFCMELTHVILPGAFALDMMVTSCPACFKLPTKALPMKPVPPPGKKIPKIMIMW